jgi:hypothetical protein
LNPFLEEIHMLGKRTAVFILAASLALGASCFEAYAGERSRSGSYQGAKTGGTWQQHSDRTPGHVDRSTTWQNERGQGSRVVEKNWNREAGTGSYSGTTTGADGRTTSRQGTVTRTGEGSYSVEGTRTRPDGKVVEVDRDIRRNPDGSTSVHSVTTGPEGRSRTVDSTTRKTEDGRSVTGTYSTSGGRSGSFDSNVTRTETGVVKSQSVTNQDGQTWRRGIDRTRQGGTVTREVDVTNPRGQTRSRTGSVTVD